MVVPVSEDSSPFVSGVDRIAALIALAPHVAVAADLELERLGQRVHDGDADAVQPARNLVPLAAELPARVELGQHDLGGRQPDALHDATGIPRPLSVTVTRVSGAMVTVMWSQ